MAALWHKGTFDWVIISLVICDLKSRKTPLLVKLPCLNYFLSHKQPRGKEQIHKKCAQLPRNNWPAAALLNPLKNWKGFSRNFADGYTSHRTGSTFWLRVLLRFQVVWLLCSLLQCGLYMRHVCVSNTRLTDALNILHRSAVTELRHPLCIFNQWDW